MSDLDEEGYLHTESGHKIPKLKVGSGLFVDKTIVVYGPSKTGKTVIVKNIMKTVHGHIEQILVVAPTEPANHSYKGFVDPAFIHYRLYKPDPDNPKKDDGVKGSLRFLEAIWKRQEMAAAIYNRANEASVLAQLFGRLPREDRAEGLRHIKAINAKRERVIERARKQYSAEPGRFEEKVGEINAKFKQMLVLLYKRYIVPQYESLWATADLTEDERYSLHYLQFNPRLLLVFDDCAAQLKPFFNKEIFRLLFYQNRHSYITVVLVCQDDTDLVTNLRKNAFLSFFTTGIVCCSNFERPSNKFPKDVKAFVGGIVPDVFQGNRKLAYIREDDARQNYYHVEFPYPRPFLFGSRASHELCALVRSTGVAIDRENPYYEHFRLG